MEARISGSGAERYLTADALALYERHASEQLHLYQVADSEQCAQDPACSRYVDFEIVSIRATGDGDFEAVVAVTHEYLGVPYPDAFREALRVGPSADSGLAFVILSASGGEGP